MGLWETITGRRQPPQPKLDQLFALPTAAITLQAGLNFAPTGRGAVCFQGAAGPAMDDVVKQVVEMLNNDDDPKPVEVSTDQYGYTWLLSYQDDVSALATDLHGVATSLELQGYADRLLCALVSFRDPQGRELALVYLAKTGTFYPFAPTGAQQRNNVLEVQVKDLLAEELPIERDLQRWMALWGAPGL